MPAKEFVLRHEFKDAANLKEGQTYYSEWEEHFNLKWRISIEKGTHLQFFMYSDLKEEETVLLNYSLSIIPATGDALSQTNNRLYSAKSRSWGYSKFAEWKNVLDKYLTNGNLKVEAHVTVLKMTGIPRRRFGEDAKKFSDVALAVKGEKFYVSKLFLSSQSAYFEALFLGCFQESGKPEVELKDVEASDLQNFLEVVYGEPSIDDVTVEGVLSLADMYDTRIAVTKCEDFLTKESEKSLKEKLQLAGKYHLEGLKKICMDEIKSVADIRSVTSSNTEDMDHKILAELFDKLLALH